MINWQSLNESKLTEEAKNVLVSIDSTFSKMGYTVINPMPNCITYTATVDSAKVLTKEIFNNVFSKLNSLSDLYSIFPMPVVVNGVSIRLILMKALSGVMENIVIMLYSNDFVKSMQTGIDKDLLVIDPLFLIFNGIETGVSKEPEKLAKLAYLLQLLGLSREYVTNYLQKNSHPQLYGELDSILSSSKLMYNARLADLYDTKRNRLFTLPLDISFDVLRFLCPDSPVQLWKKTNLSERSKAILTDTLDGMINNKDLAEEHMYLEEDKCILVTVKVPDIHYTYYCKIIPEILGKLSEDYRLSILKDPAEDVMVVLAESDQYDLIVFSLISNNVNTLIHVNGTKFSLHPLCLINLFLNSDMGNEEVVFAIGTLARVYHSSKTLSISGIHQYILYSMMNKLNEFVSEHVSERITIKHSGQKFEESDTYYQMYKAVEDLMSWMDSIIGKESTVNSTVADASDKAFEFDMGFIKWCFENGPQSILKEAYSILSNNLLDTYNKYSK